MEAHRAADWLQLDVLRVLRSLWRSAVVDPLDQAAVLTDVARRLDAMADEAARRAIASGDSYGQVAKALGVSRATAHRRYSDADPP